MSTASSDVALPAVCASADLKINDADRAVAVKNERPPSSTSRRSISSQLCRDDPFCGCSRSARLAMGTLQGLARTLEKSTTHNLLIWIKTCPQRVNRVILDPFAGCPLVPLTAAREQKLPDRSFGPNADCWATSLLLERRRRPSPVKGLRSGRVDTQCRPHRSRFRRG